MKEVSRVREGVNTQGMIVWFLTSKSSSHKARRWSSRLPKLPTTQLPPPPLGEMCRGSPTAARLLTGTLAFCVSSAPAPYAAAKRQSRAACALVVLDAALILTRRLCECCDCSSHHPLPHVFMLSHRRLLPSPHPPRVQPLPQPLRASSSIVSRSQQRCMTLCLSHY